MNKNDKDLNQATPALKSANESYKDADRIFVGDSAASTEVVELTKSFSGAAEVLGKPSGGSTSTPSDIESLLASFKPSK